MELDGVFKKLLLLKKKKYAGLAVTNYMENTGLSSEVKEETKLEIKGMDMIRRDWSNITKIICRETLNILMTNGDLENVYSYLSIVNENLNKYILGEPQIQSEEFSNTTF